MIKLIIWDYNGTVVNDIDTSVAAVNSMLSARGLPLTDKETYIETLQMPLDKYYSTIGIHNIDISTLSIEFREKCLENSHLSKIFDDFYTAIEKSVNLDIKNILMSSLFEDYLFEELEKYKIKNYFDDVFGMKDTNVGSKYYNAKEVIKREGVSPSEVLFVGDLLSDAQIAEALDCKCVLIPRGHMSRARLQQSNAIILNSLAELAKYLELYY